MCFGGRWGINEELFVSVRLDIVQIYALLGGNGGKDVLIKGLLVRYWNDERWRYCWCTGVVWWGVDLSLIHI